jgi:hypothetical protein
MADASYTAKCICGGVELEVSGAPAVSGFCHCDSCRSWLGAPVHAFTLWPRAQIKVRKGKEQIGVFKRTENSHRSFCKNCGGHVFVDHPGMNMTDVLAVTMPKFPFQPTLHVHYGEKVLSMRDGLPKYRNMPKEFGGSGEKLPD